MAREPRCVRSGPIWPFAAVPRSAWQLAHWSAEERGPAGLLAGRGRRPRPGRLVAQPGAERRRGLRVDVHRHVRVLDAAELRALPAVAAGPVGLEQIRLLRPGIMSILRFSRGTQNEWMTSPVVAIRFTRVPRGCGSRSP